MWAWFCPEDKRVDSIKAMYILGWRIYNVAVALQTTDDDKE